MRKPVLIALLLGLLLSSSALAQRSQDFGNYVVHFNALNTNLIPPAVAQHYEIQRSSTRALLNVSILSKVLNTPGTPVHAKVTATARNLSGQLRDIEIKEVDDQSAVYYLGQIRVRNEETFDFTVNITPDGEDEPLVVRFRQQFFTE